MENKNQLLFAHALVVLPDKRILLRRLCRPDQNNSKWAITIERAMAKKDTPALIITEAITNDLNINLTINNKIPKATIQSFNDFEIPKYNRKLFPFVVNVKQMLTLKSDINYQLSARPFHIVLKDIQTNATPYHKLSETEYTLNTVETINYLRLNPWIYNTVVD